LNSFLRTRAISSSNFDAASMAYTPLKCFEVPRRRNYQCPHHR
jgi:hypothetical protein